MLRPVDITMATRGSGPRHHLSADSGGFEATPDHKRQSRICALVHAWHVSYGKRQMITSAERHDEPAGPRIPLFAVRIGLCSLLAVAD